MMSATSLFNVMNQSTSQDFTMGRLLGNHEETNQYANIPLLVWNLTCSGDRQSSGLQIRRGRRTSIGIEAVKLIWNLGSTWHIIQVALFPTPVLLSLLFNTISSLSPISSYDVSPSQRHDCNHRIREEAVLLRLQLVRISFLGHNDVMKLTRRTAITMAIATQHGTAGDAGS
jgi:hypothetical protein